MDRWKSKVAVVTGAKTGIGAAICVGLAKAGLEVVGLVLPSSMDQHSDVAGMDKIWTRGCDVSKLEEINEFFKWVKTMYGGVHVLVNNAGVLVEGQISDAGDGARVLTDEDIARTIDVNVTGLVNCTRRAVSMMKLDKFDGHIFNIASILGHYVPSSPSCNVYCPTKFAVTAITAALAQELALFKNKIKTTNISPGLVQTVLASGLIKKAKLPVLKPEDIADAVVYALSTPPNVNITEVTVVAVGQTFL